MYQARRCDYWSLILCAVDENYRVVVVGNDGANAALVDQHLAGSGIHVERLACGKALLDGGRRRLDADLIIVDAVQGGAGGSVCGLALGRQLKSCPQTVSIPVIVVGNSTEHRLKSFEIGVDDYLSSEISTNEFLLRLRGILRVSAARRAASALRLKAEERRCKELGDAFRRYVAPTLVDQILANSRMRGSALANRSKRVNATVLFADMRGFTSMSERLSADDVVPLLNEYFRLLTEIVFQYEGTVFNMAGDCLMVGFGVPFEQSDATVRAFQAAKEMLGRFSDLVADWKEKFGIEVGLGIGINKGEVIAGNVGSPNYMSYTIIGDAVNVAARLSQRARAGEMLFSHEVKRTLDAGGEDCGAVLMEPISLRGRAESIDIFCVPVKGRLDIANR